MARSLWQLRIERPGGALEHWNPTAPLADLSPETICWAIQEAVDNHVVLQMPDHPKAPLDGQSLKRG